MKKLLVTLCALALVLACAFLLPTQADAATVDSGECGDNLTWTLDDAGTLTVTGTGEMNIYENWNDNKQNIVNVVIGDGVTTIGDSAFSDCTELTSVTIGKDVKTIGYSAFSSCTALESVVIPDSVTKIDHFAFQLCKKLSEVTMSANVESIGSQAFFYCGFDEIALPNTLTTLGESAFSTTKLKSVVIPDSVTELGNYVFSGCDNLAKVTLGAGITELPEGTFSSCNSLVSVTIPDGVTTIGTHAFSSCMGLEKVTVGSGVTTIGEYAFGFCEKLQKVILPAGLTTVEGYAFYSCGELDTVYFAGTQDQWTAVSVGESNYDLENVAVYFPAPTDIVSLSVTKLPEKLGYYKNEKLSLEGIELEAVCADGSTEPLVEPHITAVSSVDMSTTGTKTVTVNVGTATASFTIGVHEGGANVADPATYPAWEYSGETSVEPQSFQYNGARELVLTFSDDSGFFYSDSGDPCYSGNVLIYDEYDNLLQSLSGDFSGRSITVPGDSFTVKVENDPANGKFAFSSIVANVVTHNIKDRYCTVCGCIDPSKYIAAGTCGESLTWELSKEGTLNIFCSGPNTMDDYILDENTYTINAPWDAYAQLVKSLVIGENVSTIGKYAFYNLHNLYSVTLPESLTEIKDYAFGSCYNLRELHYAGTNTQWENLSKGTDNYNLDNANRYCAPPADMQQLGLSQLPYTTSYIVGEELSLDGIMLYTVHEDGEWEYFTQQNIDSVSEVDMSTTGKKTVTVTVNGFSASFSIGVHEGKYTASNAETYPETDHNYINGHGYSETFTYEGAQSLRITFSEDSKTEFCDRVYIYDDTNGTQTAELSGDFGGKTVIVNGDTFTIAMSSDNVTNDYGYKITAIEARTVEHTEENNRCTICDKFDPADFVASGICGEGVSWTLDDAGTLCIFGSGEVWNGCHWGVWNESVKNVIIEDGVTNIGDDMFSSGINLVSVTIPGSVTKIGASAFAYCDSLTQITIPESITAIGYNAFYDSGLTGITIPKSVTSIDDGAFSWCEELEGITLNEGLTSIGEQAFYNCQNLESITIPNSVTSLGIGAFISCSGLKNVTLGSGLKTLGDYMFQDCYALTSITIPAGVTGIGESVFSNCRGLTSINLPEGVTSIGSNAFVNCENLKTVTLPASLTSIGQWAFSGCYGLETVCFDGTRDQWASVTIDSGNAYLTDATLMFAVPKDVTSISVTKLPDKTVYNVGQELDLSGIQLTAQCASGAAELLSDWHIDAVSDVDMTTAGKKTVTVTVGEFTADFQIGVHALSWSEVADSATYPQSEHDYADYAADSQTFTYEGANELELTFSEESCTENGCDFVCIYDANNELVARLTGDLGGKTIVVSGDTFTVALFSDGSVTRYGYSFSSIVARKIAHDYADGYCTICGRYDPSVFINVGTCGDSITWELTTDGTLTISGSGEMNCSSYGIPWGSHSEEILTVVIENGITTIGDSAFSGCVNLKSVSIPSSVTKIGDVAFGNCTSLENVEIPESVGSIGWDAFRASGLTEIDIPDSVTDIVYGSFRDCTSLKTVELPSKLESINSTMFMNCTSLETVALPNTIQEIAWAAFWGCTSLETVDVPEGTIEVSVDAFRDCVSLTNVTLPSSLTIAYRSAFEGCTNLTYNEHDNALYLGNSDNPYMVLIKVKDDQSTTCKIHEDTVVIAGGAFSKSYLTSIDIPDGVVSISNGAFSGCSFLTEVNIPDSVNYIGSSAFSCCERLKSITLPEGIATINEWTFNECYALESITIPDSVRYINSWAFYCCSNLNKVILGDGVQSIEYDAFSCCYSLEKIVLPTSLTYVGYSAFYDCGSLTSVFYKGTEALRDEIYEDGDNDCLFNADWYYEYDENAKYTVVFKNGDKVVSSTEYHMGDEVAVPADPTKAADNTYTYTFSGWNKEVVDCVGDATYTATYTKTYKNYTVTFKNEDGTVLSKKTYHYGDKVTVPADPTKAGNNTYTYAFKGWDKTVTTCKGNATYTAVYTATYNDYTVTFKNADGTVLSKKTYHIGDKVTVPADPTKAADKTYTYTFAGWDKKVTTCNGTATYTATYDKTYKNYTVTFKNEDGTVLSKKTYHYGDKVKAPADPTKASTKTYKYTFNGWDKSVVKCAGNATYTATYKATKIKYTVKFVNDDGEVISSKTYNYGAKVSVPDDPTMSGSYIYTFDGWDKTVSKTCKGSVTYTATYDLKLKTPSVTGDNDEETGKPVVSWKKIKGAKKYEIYRATSKSGKYTKIATTSKTSYTDKSAKTGKTYYYKVRALSSKSSIEKSAFSSVDKIACKLKTPTIKVTQKTADGKNVIKWSKVSGAKKYVLQVSVNGGKYKTLTTTTKTSYTHKNLVGGRTYRYRLIAKASKSAYDSAYSDVKKVTAKCAQPDVTVKLNSSKKPVIKWDDVKGAKKYQIYVATSKNGTYKLLTTTTKEAYTHKKASSGKTYYYKVRAIDVKSAKGSFSDVVRIKVK